MNIQEMTYLLTKKVPEIVEDHVCTPYNTV